MAKTAKKKKAAASKPPTKSEVFSEIADKTDLSKKDVRAVFDALEDITRKSLRKHEQFNLPGMCKLVVKKKPRVPAGERRNPFTGETKWMPAKPASKTVRIRPLKNVKDMV